MTRRCSLSPRTRLKIVEFRQQNISIRKIANVAKLLFLTFGSYFNKQKISRNEIYQEEARQQCFNSVYSISTSVHEEQISTLNTNHYRTDQYIKHQSLQIEIRTDQYIKHQTPIITDRTRTAVDIQRDVNYWKGVKMSVWTLRRRPRDFGLYGRLACKKFLVSLKKRVQRLSFAKDHSD